MQAWTATLAIGEWQEQTASADLKSLAALCKGEALSRFTKDTATLCLSDSTTGVLCTDSC